MFYFQCFALHHSKVQRSSCSVFKFVLLQHISLQFISLVQPEAVRCVISFLSSPADCNPSGRGRNRSEMLRISLQCSGSNKSQLSTSSGMFFQALECLWQFLQPTAVNMLEWVNRRFGPRVSALKWGHLKERIRPHSQLALPLFPVCWEPLYKKGCLSVLTLASHWHCWGHCGGWLCKGSHRHITKWEHGRAFWAISQCWAHRYITHVHFYLCSAYQWDKHEMPLVLFIVDGCLFLVQHQQCCV